MNTIYQNHQHALPAAREHTGTRTAVLSAARAHQAEPPIMGISYRCDFRAEEEMGQGKLAATFASTGDPQSNPYRSGWVLDHPGRTTHFTQADHLTLTEDALCLHTDRPSPSAHRQLSEALSYIEHSDNADTDRLADPRGSTMAHMRVEASQLKIPGRTKMNRAELLAAIRAAKAPQGAARPSHAAWFHYGNMLVLPRTDDDFGQVVTRLASAAEAGALGVGGLVATFSRGLFLFDTRDLGEQARAGIHDANQEHRADMAALAPVEQRMTARGHRPYFLGNPRRDEDGSARYWLNGPKLELPSGRTRQVHGWYTLDELDAQKYVTDFEAKN